MEELIFLKRFAERSFGGIFVMEAGAERCDPEHTFGPAVRDHYLLHFCLSGKGSFQDPRGTHAVGAGEIFVIKPEEVTLYSADRRAPWHYVWLGFLGEDAHPLKTAASVYKTPAQIGERLYRLVEAQVSAPEIYISLVYELLYHLFYSEAGSGEDPQEDRLRRIHRYVRYNYMKPLTVEGLARRFGFDRSHLFRIFKARYGMGLKAYLTKTRMRAAAALLSQGHSVSEAGRLVGFEDAFNFSKSFKKEYGVSPSRYIADGKAKR